ncbi:bifunctional phosphoglucose/phosphomannose isomerase [Candidatus Woesearchaeota archaeon]|nr:bifunctional phosphoglucose/phosphomannose isomerase [Candidatus Woesearchaeota archaeon]
MPIDPDLLKQLDSQDMLGVLQEFPEQLVKAAELGLDIKVNPQPSNIIVTGMGGSGHPGDMLAAYAQSTGLKIPVFVVRDYEIPGFMSSSSLVFAISYSGNTEETISSLRSAYKRGLRPVVITSGGRLRQMAEEYKLPLVVVPSGIQPRLSLGYMFFPMLNILAHSGIIKDAHGEMEKAASFLRHSKVKEQSFKIAERLVGKVPLVYASRRMGIAAYIWKILINECSKTHCFSNVFPEMNHNELNAFGNFTAKYHAIFLRDEDDHERVRLRMDVSKDMIAKSGVETTDIVLKGNSFLTKLFTAIYAGMYVSFYLAIMYRTDPSPVPVVEELKQRLAKKRFIA